MDLSDAFKAGDAIVLRVVSACKDFEVIDHGTIGFIGALFVLALMGMHLGTRILNYSLTMFDPRVGLNMVFSYKHTRFEE